MTRSNAAVQHDETLPHPSPRALPGRLEFSRTDLVFRFDETAIDIALRVRNSAPHRSPPSAGYIEAAPFGAFLPWTPLTGFEVPSLAPGAATIVRLRVPRPALGGGEPPDIERPQTVDGAAKLGGRELPVIELLRRLDPAARLARSLLTPEQDEALRRAFPGLPRREEFAFAGNLNVHLGEHSVERHCCGPQNLISDACNVAMFYVGDGTDAYRFGIAGVPSGWDVRLHAGWRDGLVEIVSGRWYEGASVRAVQMLVTDAEGSTVGERLEVTVEQQSSGRVAIVEFEFESRATNAA